MINHNIVLQVKNRYDIPYLPDEMKDRGIPDSDLSIYNYCVFAEMFARRAGMDTISIATLLTEMQVIYNRCGSTYLLQRVFDRHFIYFHNNQN